MEDLSKLLQRKRNLGPILPVYLQFSIEVECQLLSMRKKASKRLLGRFYTISRGYEHFCVSFHGTLIHAAVNYPGSRHNRKASISSSLYYPKLSDELTPLGYAILDDNAFLGLVVGCMIR